MQDQLELLDIALTKSPNDSDLELTYIAWASIKVYVPSLLSDHLTELEYNGVRMETKWNENDMLMNRYKQSVKHFQALSTNAIFTASYNVFTCSLSTGHSVHPLVQTGGPCR